ncbi:TauD/TfdA family dioxygenase [Sphaerisporangium rhizosphaerae]|uniref:TauD/TfdA family dioxygenase n=1 Tax=Sphaerisporangium rhizosphaerae TaxID=2269375 RepID=A0ABW2NYV2_9ACTN
MRLLTPDGRRLGSAEARERLAETGVLLLDQATVEEVRSFLYDWTEPYPHPHENSPGITIIEPTDTSGEKNGRGFTREPLPLHTDRAHTRAQPTIVGCLSVEHACQGGQSLLLDGARAIREAKEKRLLADAGNVVLLAPGHPWLPVIKFSGDSDLWRIRYRSDALARPHAATLAAKPLLRLLRTLPAPADHAFVHGQGYLIHNLRMLHGRRAFIGDRRAVRLLATVTRSSEYAYLNEGFRLPAEYGSDETRG